MAEGALRAMGLTGPFGEEILLLGHRATSTNNPHHAGLECGACAGHSGEPNAAVLAELLNDARIRQHLRSRGIDLPPTTRVLSGLHDTTRERVLVSGACSKELADALERASGTVATWRASGGLQGADHARALLDRKASDWSEVRPEWGLANHAAFVIGPRSSFRGLDLEGRVFLPSETAPSWKAKGQTCALDCRCNRSRWVTDHYTCPFDCWWRLRPTEPHLKKWWRRRQLSEISWRANGFVWSREQHLTDRGAGGNQKKKEENQHEHPCSCRTPARSTL